MTGDLVVVLPGMAGSTLSARGRDVWAPTGGGLVRAVARLGDSLALWRLPDGLGDGHPDDGVEPGRLVAHTHVIPGVWTTTSGYHLLLRRLNRLGFTEETGNVLPVAYDWRLSIRYSGRWLAGVVEPALQAWRERSGNPDAQLVFVCQGMGGLVAQWYTHQHGNPDDTRAVVTFGPPVEGAATVLGQLANGLPDRFGPLAGRLTGFARGLPSLHQLLPTYPCVDDDGTLRTLTASTVPGVTAAMAADAEALHADLAGSAADVARHAIVGVDQPTWSTVRVTGQAVELAGQELGDGIIRCTDLERSGTTVHQVVERHGSLHTNPRALDILEKILTGRPVRYRSVRPGRLGVTAPDLVSPSDPVRVTATVGADVRDAVAINVYDENEPRRLVFARRPPSRAGEFSVEVPDLPPGGYDIEVSGVGSGSPIPSVTAHLLVWSSGDTPTTRHTTHRVRSGDTLSGIAASNGMTLSELRALNPGLFGSPDLMFPGIVLNLDPDAGSLASAEEPDDSDEADETVEDVVVAERVVNTLVVPAGGDPDPAITRPLDTGADYEVLVNIGAHVAAALLSTQDARWPGDKLPTGDLPLRVVLDLTGTDRPLVARFTLPAAGASFTCDCPDTAQNAGRHPADCARRPWVRLPITTPATPTVWTGELVIYHEVVAVHSEHLTLPIATPGPIGPHARLLHRLTTTFDDLDLIAERTASLTVSGDGSRVLVNGLTFAANPVSVSADAANGATRSAREQLYGMHLTTDKNGKLVSRLDDRFGKDPTAFEADLLTLARLGWIMFDRLFQHDTTSFDTLPALIRAEAVNRGRVPILNVADPTTADPEREPPLPWALIYDLPITQTGDYTVCPSVHRFGPAHAEPATPHGIPTHCPEALDHTANVLCPFGFWGLSCIIEQPASTTALTRTVLDSTRPAAVTMAIDPGLDSDLTDTHLTRLRAALPPGSLTDSTVTSGAQLATALATDTMDVVYLYCHGGYYETSANAKPATVLRFDTSLVHPADIAAWRSNRSLWPATHWKTRQPLVIMNGCHTVELTTATLGNFVDAFTNRARASGVIGTEVTIDQAMASWASELLLDRIVTANTTAGHALRGTRWAMLSRGNVMGLAYTLYCTAGLQLRPPPRKGTP